jgi:hypothetical protein
MSVYTGKFNYSPYASNENIFVVLLDGWVERGRVQVFSTFTRDAAGVDKRPFDLTTAYVLKANDANANSFTIRDLDQKVYYWFDGARAGDTLTLNLHNPSQLVSSGIVVKKLN